MRTGRTATALLLALGVLLLAACGGDSDDENADSDGRVSLRLTQPTNGATVNADSVEVAGQVTPGASVDVNSRAANVAGNAFRATVAGLDRGQNSIDVRAAKPGMQPASASLTVTRTAAAPAKEKAPAKGSADSGQTSKDSANDSAEPAPAPSRKPKSIQARLREHLRRYDGESWYRSVRGVTVRTGSAIISTGLMLGTTNARRQAGRICRAVLRFRLPKSVTLVLVSGQAAVIVRYCTIPGRQPKRL